LTSGTQGEAGAFWQSAPLADLEKRLAAPGFLLNAEIAQAVRDRVAVLVFSDASHAYTLSGALMKALRRQPTIPDDDSRAIVWRCRAEASLFSGRLKSGKRAYEKAAAAAADSPHLLGQILVGRVHLLSLMGEEREASRFARRAEPLLEKAGDQAYLAKLHMNRGNIFYQKEDYARALEAYQRASKVFDRAGIRDPNWVSLIMNQAIACTNLGRLPEAKRIFRRTLKYCERLGLEALSARATYNRAFLEALRGNYRSALSDLELAGSIFERHDILDMMGATQRARAEIYLDLGMPEEAGKLSRAAAEVFTAQGMPLDACLARMDEAQGLMLSGRVTPAVEILEEAVAFLEKQRIRPRLAGALVRLADAFLKLGRPGEAARMARRARGVFDRLGMLRGASQARRVIAESWLARRQPGRAERELAPALEAAPRQTTNERLKLWSLAGTIARARGHRPEALRRLRRAVTYLEAERRLIPGTVLRAYAFEDRVRIYHDLIALALEAPAPRFDVMFKLVEAARARGFRDRAEMIDNGASQTIVAQRAHLGALTRRLHKAEYGDEGPTDPAEIARLHTQVRRLERQINDQLHRAEASRPGGSRWSGAGDPDTIAGCLKADETLIEYFLAGDGAFVLALGRGRRTFRTLPHTTSEIARLVKRVRFLIDSMALSPSPPADTIGFLQRTAEDALRKVHAALMAPIGDLLPQRGRLIIVPHGILHQVPFESFPEGDGYIDDRFVISRCPSADWLLRRRRPRSRRRTVLLTGTVTSGPASVSRELEAVAGFFPADTVRVLRDPRSQEILSAMSDCRLLHLSAHGEFREDNPLFSSINMADGAIFLADLLGSRLSADLVVLSACSSGRVFTGQGDDLSGVAHGFLAAGARQLVAGMWRIHDQATQDLMTAFYRHYTGDARRDAARALTGAAREGRAEWKHPFFWGCFSVHGA